ncbi:MAG: type II toxin-antitoxin system RelE/ParE family toxin [Lentisphaeraceae bacterium]|nr:type II toxin-antitoxin system RelE/ParE family toxin [Lentisphaeraceae bacterium]
MNYFFSEDAYKDLEESELHYNNEQFGLGEEFLDEVFAGVLHISDDPSIWQKVHKELQRYSLKRFPFKIIYRVQGDAIQIVAINHDKRHPKYWKK